MIKEEGEKRNFLSDYFSVKPVCPCPTAGGPARRQAGTGREGRCGMPARRQAGEHFLTDRFVGFLLKLSRIWIFTLSLLPSYASFHGGRIFNHFNIILNPSYNPFCKALKISFTAEASAFSKVVNKTCFY